MIFDHVVACLLNLLMVWCYVRQLIDMDLRARRGLINHSHVRREWLRMSVGLEGLIEQFYLFGKFGIALPSGLVRKKGLFMPGARWSWLWSGWDALDRLHVCVGRSRCPDWKRDMWKGAPHNKCYLKSILRPYIVCGNREWERIFYFHSYLRKNRKEFGNFKFYACLNVPMNIKLNHFLLSFQCLITIKEIN